MVLTQDVNKLLDTAKNKLQISSDTQLAAHFNVTPMTIARWRGGKSLGKAVQVLLPIAMEEQAQGGCARTKDN
jgi:hypothetical protein